MQVQAIAQAGLDAAVSRLDASAWRTTLSPNADYAQEAVEQTEAATSFKADLKVMQTADQMTGTLVDMKV
jgi:flagellar hook protein FlgE